MKLAPDRIEKFLQMLNHPVRVVPIDVELPDDTLSPIFSPLRELR